jgi:hypothetical protein
MVFGGHSVVLMPFSRFLECWSLASKNMHGFGFIFENFRFRFPGRAQFWGEKLGWERALNS